MQTKLIQAGLVFIPFYEVILRSLPFVQVVAKDSRVPKEAIALWFIVAIGLFAFLTTTIKPVRNKWIVLFLLSCFVSIYKMPVASLNINGIEVHHLWVWETILKMFLFYVLLLGVSSAKININRILTTISWCGFLMGVYVILQYFGFDQFWTMKEEYEFRIVTRAALAGNLGQPTIVSPFIGLTLPVCLYQKRYFFFLSSVAAVALTQSVVAIIGVVVGLTAYLAFRSDKARVGIILLLLVAGVILTTFYFTSPQKFTGVLDDNGRLGAWKAMIAAFKQKNLCITGWGPGSFRFLFHSQNPTYKAMHQAHNDWLEILINHGFLGLGCLVAAVGGMVMSAFRNFTPLSKSLLSSIICVMICAFGTFVFQMYPISFYTVVIMGCLYNTQQEVFP